MDIKEAYKYCPRCGSKFSNEKNYLRCGDCGLHFYASPKPAASVILYDKGNKYLFGKRATEPKLGYWDTIGGFVDENETFEQCAIRETKEELGLDINRVDLKYLSSFLGEYSYQGIDYKVINVVFTAEMPAGVTPKPADDVAEYAFFKAEDIPAETLAFAWLRDMLKKLPAQNKN